MCLSLRWGHVQTNPLWAETGVSQEALDVENLPNILAVEFVVESLLFPLVINWLTGGDTSCHNSATYNVEPGKLNIKYFLVEYVSL